MKCQNVLDCLKLGALAGGASLAGLLNEFDAAVDSRNELSSASAVASSSTDDTQPGHLGLGLIDLFSDKQPDGPRAINYPRHQKMASFGRSPTVNNSFFNETIRYFDGAGHESFVSNDVARVLD
eukprot:Trichotokara_eunicae@DN8836_c0_g1_i1.p1